MGGTRRVERRGRHASSCAWRQLGPPILGERLAAAVAQGLTAATNRVSADPSRPMPARPRNAMATRPATNAFCRASSPTRPRRAPTPELLPGPPRRMARPATRPGRPATRPVGVTSPLGPRSHVLAYGRPRRAPKRSCKPHVSPRNRGIGSSPETVWPSTSGPRTVSAAFEPLEVKFCPNCPSRLTSADGNPVDASEQIFDTGKVARPVLNVEQPPHIPQRPMGSIPVGIRLVRPDGEEWWPGTANLPQPGRHTLA